MQTVHKTRKVAKHRFGLLFENECLEDQSVLLDTGASM